jgi:hypothetical protein
MDHDLMMTLGVMPQDDHTATRMDHDLMMTLGVMSQDDQTASHDETFLGWENHGHDEQGA